MPDQKNLPNEKIEIDVASDRFHDLFNTMDQGVIYHDAQGGIILANPAAQEMLGLTLDQLQGRLCVDPRWQAIREDGRPFPGEEHPSMIALKEGRRVGRTVMGMFNPRDNSHRWFAVYATPKIRSGEQKPFEVFASFTDITESKAAEDRLHQSEQRFRKIFGDAPIGIGQTDLSGKIIRANRSLSAFLEYSEEELLGRNVLELTSPEDRNRSIALARKLFLGQIEVMALEKRYLTRSGKKVTGKTWGTVIRDQENKPAYILSLIEDVTECKELSQTLLRTEEHLRSLIDFLPIVLFSTDKKGILTLSAGRGLQFTDFYEGEIVAQSIFDLFGSAIFTLDSGRKILGREVFASVLQGQAMSAVVSYRGTLFDTYLQPKTNAENEIQGLTGLALDITEKIQVQKQAMKAARLASLGELAAGVAHEINNPNALNLINVPILMELWEGVSGVLEEHYKREGDFRLGRMLFSEVREHIPRLFCQILDGAKRIKHIVAELKDYSGKGQVREEESIALNDVVEASLRLTNYHAKKAASQIHANLAADLPPVLGNFQGLEQVIVNLLINACQALAGGEGNIYLETHYEAEQKSVIFRIRDEGKGISPDLIPRLTEPFFTTRRKEGGTGLGLAISDRIVREHGGSLEFSSAPDHGTLVSFKLPALKEIP